MKPRQTPTLELNVPDGIEGAAGIATELASQYFGAPMPWQPHLLDVMLATDGDGMYVNSEVGISVPRQNGKSWVVRSRCFDGLMRGEKILYTCHHGDTSDEMFQELKAPFEDDEEEELRDLLKYVRKTNGKQAIVLNNGGTIRFTTRTDSGGRGKSFDVLIIDEAQELTDMQQAALLPAISAGKMHNPQTIYLGTPPGPKCLGTVFANLRESILKGDSQMAWMEWGATEIGDKNDRSRWYESNPSLGIVLELKAVESECNQMAPDTFARERLGWWADDAEVANPALPPGLWAKREVGQAMTDGKLAFGVKFSTDGRTAAISWARAMRGGPSYVELYDVACTDGGTAVISDMLLRNKGEIAAVCIDGKSGADALIQRLGDNAFPKKAVVSGSPAIVQAAASMLLDELKDGSLGHIASPALDESAARSVKRDIGSAGGWGFGDGPNSIAAPIESASLALYAARTTKRDPSRKQEANF